MSIIQDDDITLQAERWINIEDEDVTVELIEEILSSIPDDVWVAAACVDKLVDDVEVQRQLIHTGLGRTEEAAKNARTAIELAKSSGESDGEVADPARSEESLSKPATLEFEDGTKELIALRRTLLRTSDRLETWAAMAKQFDWRWKNQEEEKEEEGDKPFETEASPDPYAELDPWADLVEEESPPTPQAHLPTLIPPPISLKAFLSQPLLHSALTLAAATVFEPLKFLITRHTPDLSPYRFAILDAVPSYAHPSLFPSILPIFDYPSSRELLPNYDPWRETPDWSEMDEASALIQDVDPQLQPEEVIISNIERREDPYTDLELSHWYRSRVRKIDSQSGLIDIALEFVQHGASQGIPGLDELGEELSLLSRLVYDTRSDGSEDWSLRRWGEMDTGTIIRSYLSLSTPETVADDIRRLVLPYLYVLEARAERTGTPDPTIPTRFLYDYLLSAPLPIAASIFEASKATLPVGQRLIRQDEDVVRLALAILYGSDSLYEWGTMSQIFECMPEFPVFDTEDEEDEEEAADTTLHSLASYVTPTASRSKIPPKELLVFFQPLPAKSLSRALDVLDVHLESGETLSRWEVPAPLRWFLQSAHDEAEQRAWATRMARRNSKGVEIDDDEWLDLMKDMVKLAGRGQGPLRGAFGLLKKDEVVKIFFGGLLSLGRFALARRLLHPPKGGRPLSSKVIEQLCLHISREFYDNASSGNMNVGDMKLAYECLAVAHASPAIVAEREFIEATSKICSYDVQSQPGVSISPIEIRLVKDRLTLVARVLASSDTAYKHSEVILDLVKKLGFRDDVAAEIKALAMIADSATQAEDFPRAAEICERMAKATFEMQKKSNRRSSISSPPTDDVATIASDEAIEVCWRTCFQLGRQPEFQDVTRKLSLLAYALRLCPSENALDILSVWKKVEGESLQATRERRSRERRGQRGNRTRGRREVPAFSAARLPSLSSHLLSMPGAPLTSEAAAAMASRTLNRVAGVAANLPFSLRGRLRVDGDASTKRSGSPSSDVSKQARAALAKGVGWLIGADEDPL